MKGAIFHTAFGALGGAELLAAAQTRLLREAGLELDVVTFGFEDAPWAELFGHAAVHRIPRRSWKDAFSLQRSSKWAPRVARALPTLRGFDPVIAHSQPLAALLGHADLQGRRLWYCHEAPWRLHPDAVAYRLLQPLPSEPWLAPLREAAARVRAQAQGQDARRSHERAGTRKLQGLATNSAFAKAALRAIYGDVDVRVIPPVIRFPETVAPRQGLNRDGLRVLVQTRLGLLKNVEAVLRGFAAYAAKAAGASHLHVIGDGEDRTRLEGLAAPLGLTGRLSFHGTLDPVQDAERMEVLYRACDVFALLPLDESFGMVFPEAAARGLLLLGPDHGGPVEVLEGGDLGGCLPVFEPAALAEALHAFDRLPDAEVDARRARADAACRARYAPGAMLPALKAWVQGV